MMLQCLRDQRLRGLFTLERARQVSDVENESPQSSSVLLFATVAA